MKALAAADAFAAFPTLIWFYLFREMAVHYAVAATYGYSGAWDFAVYFPLAMALVLIVAVIFLTFVARKPGIIALVAGVALLPILPYGMMVGGGV